MPTYSHLEPKLRFANATAYLCYIRLAARAHRLVRVAVIMGRLSRLNGSVKCADCVRSAQFYDHRDYFKPLDVAPVCHKCNLRRGPAITTLAQLNGSIKRLYHPKRLVPTVNRMKVRYLQFKTLRRTLGMKKKIRLPKLLCRHCGATWMPRTENPIKCPRCGNDYRKPPAGAEKEKKI